MTKHISMKSPCCEGADLYLKAEIKLFDPQKQIFDIETSEAMTLVCDGCFTENVEWFEMIDINSDSIEKALGVDKSQRSICSFTRKLIKGF